MFGAVPAEWFMELASDMGIMTQLELDIPRHYIIDEEFLTSVPVSFYHLNGKGQKTGSMSSVDHPAFTSLRDHLEAVGYIKTERHWCNGDRVIKPFYLNDFYFNIGDKFSSAAAMAGKFRFERKRLNKEYD